MPAGTHPDHMCAAIERALQGLRYGSIQLVIHDGNLVRIERIEHTRLTLPEAAPALTRHRPTPPAEVRGHVYKES